MTGKEIKLARILKGWKQEELGRLIGTGKAPKDMHRISRLERGIVQTTPSEYGMLRRVLELKK